MIPQVGVNHIAGLVRGDGTAPISSWYIGLFEGNYVPTKGVTAADLPGVVGECTAYSQASRPAMLHVFDGESVIHNRNNRAVFSITADKTIYGAFVCSGATKGGNTGLIMLMERFSSPQILKAGTEFSVPAEMFLIPTFL